MFDQFRDKVPIDDEKWKDYTSCFNRMTAPANHALLNEGEISKKLFLIEKGCIRVWTNNNGQEVTVQFFFEYDSVSSIISFKKQRPSRITIETIEPCTLWYIHKKDVDRIIEEIKNIPELRDRFVDAIFERSFDYMKLYLSSIRDTPKQRYQSLVEEQPQIVQRVPQHYIASYFGISAVHLSRIRSHLSKDQ